MIKKCLICKKEFVTYLCLIKKGDGKFCSTRCNGISARGKKKPSISGKYHYKWTGGHYKHSQGYIVTYLPNHPFAYKGYILEHRIIIEKHLKRFLEPKEVVHHINRNPSDNRLENLIIFKNQGYHCAFHRWGCLKGIIFNKHKIKLFA